MSDAATLGPERPCWQVVADQLDKDAVAPTSEQVRVATAIGVTLPSNIPAPVAAVVLRDQLSDVLFARVGGTGWEIPDALTELEDELRVSAHAHLVTGTREEVSAWFAARYMIKTARGLRAVEPQPGDVVVSQGWSNEKRVISSIGADGRVYMKGQPPRKGWPNHLEVVARVGQLGHSTAVQAVEAALLNGAKYTSTNFAKLDELNEYALGTHVPSLEAVRALEELLESGEPREEPFQALVTRCPALLSASVVGGWKTFVIPKQRLGAEYVPDFLVLGISSIGPQWVLVELEAPRHKIRNKDGGISGPTRQGVKQIRDWREWLTTHVAYAQSGLHLYGLTSHASGLVIIGRDDPTVERDQSRAQSAEEARIVIHSWDWLLRQARNLAVSGVDVSEFARVNASSHSNGFLSAESSSDAVSLEHLDEDVGF